MVIVVVEKGQVIGGMVNLRAVAGSVFDADVDVAMTETGAAVKGVDDVMVGEGIGGAVDGRDSDVAATNAGFDDCMGVTAEVVNVVEPPS